MRVGRLGVKNINGHHHHSQNKKVQSSMVFYQHTTKIRKISTYTKNTSFVWRKGFFLLFRIIANCCIIHPVQTLEISHISKRKIKCKRLNSSTNLQHCQQTTQTLAQSFHQDINDISGFKTGFPQLSERTASSHLERLPRP